MESKRLFYLILFHSFISIFYFLYAILFPTDYSISFYLISLLVFSIFFLLPYFLSLAYLPLSIEVVDRGFAAARVRGIQHIVVN